MRALSIAGAYPLLIAERNKSIELRTWGEHKYRGIVLLHCSSSKAYDFSYEQWGVSLEECPKKAIIGAATLSDCIRYDSSEKWRRDIENHCWDISYKEMLEEYNGKVPWGHVFTNPATFSVPILDVKGTFRYWKPTTLDQRLAFALAETYR